MRRSLLQKNPKVNLNRSVLGTGSDHDLTERKIGDTQKDAKKLELLDHDTELKLLYNEYLQEIMIETIIKDKTAEKKNLIISELAAVAKKTDNIKEELLKLKIRERDIRNLIMVQEEVDSHLLQIKSYIGSIEDVTLNETLSQLHSTLKPLDLLHCNNIILPETDVEWQKMQELVKSCASNLESIKMVDNQEETYKTINQGLNGFIEMSNCIQDCQRRFKEILHSLQALVLKDASSALTEDEDSISPLNE